MKVFRLAAITLTAALTNVVFADNHEVQMLNAGTDGVMVFEPAVLKVNPGDTVTFKSANPGHNSASMEGMIPAGAESWNGGMSQDVTVTLNAEGVYAVSYTHLTLPTIYSV